MSFWKRISPVGAAKDFSNEFLRPNPYRWRIMAVSAVATFSIFSVMWNEGAKGPPAPPEVTWISTLSPDRSDAEIIAANMANQKEKDRLAAEQAARDEKVKDVYRALGRASGMDVDRIEREAKAERLAEERAEAARKAAQRGQPVDQP